MIKQNRNIELTPVSPEPLNVSALSKNDGLIRCASYNLARNLCQHPGDRKRKSPESQNTARSEIRGKSRKKSPLRHFRRMRQIEFGGKEKGNPFGLPYILASYAINFIFFTSNRIHIILNITLHIHINMTGINLLSDIIAIRLGSHLHL